MPLSAAKRVWKPLLRDCRQARPLDQTHYRLTTASLSKQTSSKAENFHERFTVRRGGTPIGANLPIWILICTFSWWFAKVALNIFGDGVQHLGVRLGGDGIDERFDDHPQESPSAVFYAAARRGESPRCSAMSGSVSKANKR